MPVGAGKQLVAETVAAWRETQGDRIPAGKNLPTIPSGAAVIVPNNLLVRQYVDGATRLPTLGRKDSYVCRHSPRGYPRTCAETYKKTKKKCTDCAWQTAHAAFLATPSYVANYYTYLAHRSWRKTLVVDEAHNLLKMLLNDSAVHVWRSQNEYPRDIATYTDALGWLESQSDKRLLKLAKMLRRDRQRSLFEITTDVLRGKDQECLKFTPIDARERPPVMWNPARVSKIVLLSATIGPEDIYDLGLDRRRVAYIETSSPIPKEQRPFVFLPTVALNHTTTEAEVDELAEKIKDITTHHAGERGVIHTTYALAKRLRTRLVDSRFMFHESHNRTAQYHAFRRRVNDAVFVACGLAEGIDLAGDAARWQIITKVPYPDLSDPAVDHKRQQRPDWYQWQAVRDVLQAYGRVCRGPDDFGVTYMLDSNFEMLYGRNRKMFPEWFVEAVEGL